MKKENKGSKINRRSKSAKRIILPKSLRLVVGIIISAVFSWGTVHKIFK